MAIASGRRRLTGEIHHGVAILKPLAEIHAAREFLANRVETKPAAHACCQFRTPLRPHIHADLNWQQAWAAGFVSTRSEEHTSELQSHLNLVCRLLLEKKK